MEHTNWYKDAIIYQIYPRSFKDSNDDGMGDIPGIISKLDYLKDLGINAIWLSPVYKSPQKDNGYDIADYRDIYEPFGTLDDMKKLINEAHKKGIRIIMDLVVNHTSNEHKWFKEALKDKNSKYRDYYIFKKGKKNGKKPPNNWSSFFVGPAWEKLPDSDEYYLHLFAKEQPDLNWENPEVRQEIINLLRFWMDLGIDGFRCDVITLLSKDQRFKDGSPISFLKGKKYYVMGPKIHEYLHLLYEKAYKDYDVMTVGETVMSTMDDMKSLVDPKRQELDMAFNFSHTDSDNYFGVKYLYRKFKLTRYKNRLAKLQYTFANDNGWNSLFIENHDQRRSTGRFNTNLELYSLKSPKALALTYFFLKGTPFIYQGQEIGMRNMEYESIDDFQDVEIHNMNKLVEKHKLLKMLFGKHLFEVARDNARTPMQWDDSMYAGFSNHKPWLKVNDDKNFINVNENLNNPDSIYHFYKKLIEIRKTYPVLKDGKFNMLFKHNKNLFVYTREDNFIIMLIMVNLSTKKIKNPIKESLKNYQLLISNCETYDEKIFYPYDAKVYYRKK